MKKFSLSFLPATCDEDGNLVYLDTCNQIQKEPDIKREEPPPEIAKPTYKQLTCKRCNYLWPPRKKQKPVQCPKCKSPYWNRPRKYSG